MELEELFRSKLESAELIPGGDIRGNLMRKLGRKEFLRFNPSRINIYYAGGIIVAGLTAGVLLTTTRSGDNTRQLIPPSEKVMVADSTGKKTVEVQLPSENIPVTGVVREISTGADQNSNQSHQNTTINTQKAESGTAVRPLPERNDSILKNNQIKESNQGAGINGLTLQKKISASFEVSELSGCMPMKVKFTNRSVAYDSSYWTFGDGGYSANRNPEWIFDMQGEYRIVLKVFRKDGSESTAFRIITVYPKPVARFEIHPDNPIIPDDEIRFMNYSMDGVKCKWEFGDGKESDEWEPVYKYNHFDKFNLRLIVWSDHGCADSLAVLNAFAGSGSYIKFPNAFIPNADGPAGGFYSSKSDEAAQIFHPVTSGVTDYQLRIFTKTGILIFESNDINFGWDGYNKGQLCEPGVYVWKVRGTYKNGEQFVKMGDLTLLRK
jgi:hypothetical protein